MMFGDYPDKADLLRLIMNYSELLVLISLFYANSDVATRLLEGEGSGI